MSRLKLNDKAIFVSTHQAILQSEIRKAVRRRRVKELEKTIKELEGSLEFYECDYCKFEQPVVDKVMEELNEHINKLKKRLLELQGVEK